MENRRTFLKKILVSGIAISYPGCNSEDYAKKNIPMKTNNPKRALVLWYSQTGHTQRIGELIAKSWKKQEIQVDAFDIRSFDKALLNKYDLIALGTPVHYCDIPVNLKEWLIKAQPIDGTSVASFVTFGGPGDGEVSTAISILDILAKKGGVPVGMETFGNMSTFAPTWSIGNEKRILKYRHLPDKNTYSNARKYAESIIKNVRQETPIKIERELSFDILMKYLPQAWFVKLLIGKHTIIEEKCVKCGTCVDKCPVNAINLEENSISTSLCIVCMGCINNCPQQAIHMEFMFKKVYGFNEFKKRNNIQILKPEKMAIL